MTNKNENYYSNIRHDLIGLITKKENFNVLEIGAGYGETIIYLKECNTYLFFLDLYYH